MRRRALIRNSQAGRRSAESRRHAPEGIEEKKAPTCFFLFPVSSRAEEDQELQASGYSAFPDPVRHCPSSRQLGNGLDHLGCLWVAGIWTSA